MTLPVFVALLGACLDAPPASQIETPARAETGDEASVAPARYLTHFAFAGLDGSALFASFDQEATDASLARAYDAWWSGPDGWERLVSVRDTLPVPRAAWRVLPSDELEVHVGDAREVVGLDFSGSGRTYSLRAGDEISVWTGPTGQRESVGMGGLTVGEDVVGGLLFFRRAARALQFPHVEEAVRGFVLADSVGNGLLIEVSESDGAVVAHTLLHGSVDAWDGVTLVADSLAAGPPRRWEFEIPGAALTGTIRAVSSPAEGPVPAFRIECDLVADGDTFRFRGLAALMPLP